MRINFNIPKQLSRKNSTSEKKNPSSLEEPTKEYKKLPTNPMYWKNVSFFKKYNPKEIEKRKDFEKMIAGLEKNEEVKTSLLNLANNSSGTFDSKNAQFITELLDTGVDFKEKRDTNFIKSLKDDKGIIKDEYKQIALDMLQYIKPGDIANYINACLCLPSGKALDILNEAFETFEDKETAYKFLGNFYGFCYKNDEPIKENIDFVKNLISKGAKADNLVNFIRFKDENGVIPKDTQKRILDYLEVNNNVYDFLKCYSDCKNKEEFNSELFEKNIKLFKTGSKTLNHEELVKLSNKINKIYKNYSPSLNERLEDLNILKNLDEELKKELNLDSLIKKLESFFKTKALNPISKKDRNVFVNDILTTKAAQKSEFESTIVSSIDKLKSFKKGIPLSYPRQEFLLDLNELNLSENILSKLQITADLPDSYEGLICLDDLDLNNPREKEVYDLCHKFLYENKVQTGDENLDRELNKIIKAVPEFINTVGKKQHSTHKYTLDVHQLLVLANSINHPDYLNLAMEDRGTLKLCALIHDINKKEGVVDKEHSNPSSISAKNIASKFFLTEQKLDDFYTIVKNHHWLEELETSSDKKEEAKQIAFNLRNKNNFEIAKIFAQADLKSVSDEFYNSKKSSLADFKLADDALLSLYSTASALFTHFPVQESGQNRVINLHEINDDEDLINYGIGFEKGLKKDDLTFLVHMVNDEDILNGLNALKELSSAKSAGALSESIITLKNQSTYLNRKYGVILSQSNADLINISDKNQRSGYKKDSSNAKNLTYSSYQRMNFKNYLLKALNVKCTNEEYAKFYKKYLISKTTLDDFDPKETIELGSKSFSAKELKEIIKDFQKSLLNDEYHNEIIGCTPKIKGVIAKAQTIDEVPFELINFADENHLPIVLI